MGLLNKIIRRSAKSTERQEQLAKEKQAKKNESATEPTIAQLAEREQLPKGESKKAPAKAVKRDDTKNAYRVLIKPMITEKGTFLASQNKYLFEVARSANKIEVKKAIKAVYGVNPVNVRIVNLPAKKLQYRRIKGETQPRKKAIVTLTKGQSIEIYEGV